MKKDERQVKLIPMPVTGLEGNLMTPTGDIQDRLTRIQANKLLRDFVFADFCRKYFPRPL